MQNSINDLGRHFLLLVPTLWMNDPLDRFINASHHGRHASCHLHLMRNKPLTNVTVGTSLSDGGSLVDDSDLPSAIIVPA